MSNDDNPFSMRNFAIFAPLAATAAFVISVTFLIGQFIGLRNISLLFFLTIGDYVNLAVPFIALLIVDVLFWLVAAGLLMPGWLDRMLNFAWGISPHINSHRPNNNLRIIGGYIGFIVLFSIVLIVGSQILGKVLLLFLGSVFVVALMMVLFAKVASRYLPTRTLVIPFLSVLVLAMSGFSGFLVGAAPACNIRVSFAGTRVVHPAQILYLDRGMVLIWPGQFRILGSAESSGVVVERVQNQQACKQSSGGAILN